MDEGKLAAGALIAEAGRQFAAHWKLAALTLVGLIVAAVIHIVIGLAVVSFAQFELTYSILAERGMLLHGYRKRRYLALFGLQAIVFAIVVIGWTLLILPGAYLMLRLYFAVPSLIAEETGVFDALAASWRRTAGQEMPLFVATLAATLPAILPWGLAFWAIIGDLGFGAVLSTILLALIGGALVPIFYACVAAVGYAETGPDIRALEEVFS